MASHVTPDIVLTLFAVLLGAFLALRAMDIRSVCSVCSVLGPSCADLLKHSWFKMMKVRQLRHCFVPFLADFSALHRSARAVWHTLRIAHACWMLIGARCWAQFHVVLAIPRLQANERVLEDLVIEFKEAKGILVPGLI